MSHRDHAEGAGERGNDWLDGALAGWLLFIAISAGPYLWGLRNGVEWPAAAFATAPVLAVAAIFPLLRFQKVGWFLALLTMGLMLAHEGIDLAAGNRVRGATAFLVVHLAGLAYLLWIVPEFWPREAHAEPDAGRPEPAQSAEGAQTVAGGTSTVAKKPVPAGPTPVTNALAAIHQRIVAAGSACAVTPVSVRAEAGRFGVSPAALQTEGLALYRTFLQHFLADGALSADEERELICLERALDLNDDGVWRLRGEAGLRGGYSPPAPAAAPAFEGLPSTMDADQATDADVLTASPSRAEIAAAPDPSAQADIAFSEPRIHSPGHSLDDVASPELVEPLAIEPAALQPAEAPAAPADDGLADYEEHELGALLRWAGIPALPRGAAPRAALERLRALHRTTTEPLDRCASDVALEPGESCLAMCTVELYRVPGTPAASPLADIPGPVLDPRALVSGDLEQDRDLSGLQRTGACSFVVTERRLLLVAPSGQQSQLPVSRLRAVRPYRNGLEVQPQRGSPLFLAFSGGADELAMRIDRVVRDLRAFA